MPGPDLATPRLRRPFARGLLALCSLLAALLFPAWGRTEAMPQPAPLPSFNPLCDSNLVPCLDIDEFAAHAYAHLLVLPRTELRDSAAVVPYGISLGLLGRIAGGLSTHYAFWQEGDAPTRRFGQHGPLRLSLSALLWPFLPLRQAPVSELGEDGESSFISPRHLRIGILYEHELRIGPFEGANQLGMLSDLAALRLVASRAFGPIEITTSAGVLFDGRGAFATGEGALQLGVYLPFFRALKLYGEALGRGGLAYVREGALPPARDPDPLRAQGVLGLGLSFRPQARVDLGVSVQTGLGGLAPSTVIARFAVLSVGKTYQGRAATPIAQMAGDAAAEAAVRIRDYLRSLPIDPVLDATCALYDDDGSLMGSFGTRTPDGRYCEKDGFKLRIGEHFDRPPDSKDRICRESDLTECVLERQGKEWMPVRRPRLDGTCMMYDRDGTPMGRWGEPTPDGERCRHVDGTQRDAQGYPLVRERRIGQDFHTDAQRSRVCDDAALTRCFMRAAPGESLQLGAGWRTAEAFLAGAQNRVEERATEAERSARALVQTARDVAQGHISLRTLGQAAVERATQLAGDGYDYLKHPEKLKPLLDQASAAVRSEYIEWRNKPAVEKAEDVASLAGSAAVDLSTRALTGTLNQAAGITKKARRAEKTGEAVAGAAAKGPQAAALVPHGSPTGVAKGPTIEHAPPSGLPQKPRHGNFVDDRPASLYEKVDKDDKLLKHGITHHEDPRKRYTKKQIGDGKVNLIERGPRKEMIKKERERVETNPGPENREPWAGKRRPPQSGE